MENNDSILSVETVKKVNYKIYEMNVNKCFI